MEVEMKDSYIKGKSSKHRGNNFDNLDRLPPEGPRYHAAHYLEPLYWRVLIALYAVFLALWIIVPVLNGVIIAQTQLSLTYVGIWGFIAPMMCGIYALVVCIMNRTTHFFYLGIASIVICIANFIPVFVLTLNGGHIKSTNSLIRGFVVYFVVLHCFWNVFIFVATYVIMCKRKARDEKYVPE